MQYMPVWWTSTEVSTPHALTRNMYYGYGALTRGTYNKLDGFSLRCVRYVDN